MDFEGLLSRNIDKHFTNSILYTWHLCQIVRTWLLSYFNEIREKEFLESIISKKRKCISLVINQAVTPSSPVSRLNYE